MLDELVKLALIGTARAGDAAAPISGPAAEMLATLPATDAESKLLDAVAVLSRYQVCGRTPTAVDTVPPVAEVDPRPPCSPRAGELLRQVLTTGGKTRWQLCNEWLSHADRADQCVPAALIPMVLNYAATADSSVRDAVVAAVGPRGAWLMAMNPQWHFGAGEEADPKAVWTTGTTNERLSVLRRLRAIDPVAAVDLLRSTWKEDGASERATCLAALAVGLSDADEPFLESALDDRSKQVRTSATSLLIRLPGSRFVQRMTERADAMLSLANGKIDVTLPKEFDRAWERDDISQKPPDAALGERQWWARQVLVAVPPTHWSSKWGIDATSCVAAAGQEDFARLLYETWTVAGKRHADAGWASALMSVQKLTTELLSPLSPAEREPILLRFLRSDRADAIELMMLLYQTSFPFIELASVALCDRIESMIDGGDVQTGHRAVNLLEAVGLRVPPASYGRLVERWVGVKWEPFRRPVDQCLATLQLRRDIQKEFAT